MRIFGVFGLVIGCGLLFGGCDDSTTDADEALAGDAGARVADGAMAADAASGDAQLPVGDPDGAVVGDLDGAVAGDPDGAVVGDPDGAVAGDPDGAGIPSPDMGPPTTSDCFGDRLAGFGPDYSELNPVMGSHCYGTNHQNIEAVQRVVFLGDSVTAGTPPTDPGSFYRTLLGERLRARFGENLAIDTCAEWGARTDDFLAGKDQIDRCFPTGGDQRRVLVIFTVGGNDIFSWAKDDLSVEDALAEADIAADLLDETLGWLKDPARFPNGSYVVFANPYEYTDATGDLSSCIAAQVLGINPNWLAGAPALAYFQERLLEMVIRHGHDLVFSQELFCGHGFRNEDPESPCYLGPDTDRWFDGTCIHPNPLGHEKLTEFFEAVIAE